LNRDFESKKHGYSAKSYLEVLEDQLPTCWEPGLIFMQDNASIHTAKVVKKWFKDIGIPLLDWPPYSPDLNLIEQV
jgi:transposase